MGRVWRRRADRGGGNGWGEDRLTALVEHASDLIVVVGPDGTPIYQSPTALEFLGSEGRDWADRFSPDSRVALRSAWAGIEAAGASRQLLVRARRSDAQCRELLVTLTNLRHVDAVGGVVVNARDVTDERRVRARLEHQATHDGLTGLPNRDAMVEHLTGLVDTRNGRPAFALTLLDLVGFASVNDRVGHIVGDYLLRAVAARLVAAGGRDALVARMSGDEFGILLLDVPDDAAALSRAARILVAFDEPFPVPHGGSVVLAARVGVACGQQGDGTVHGVLQDADLALSEATSAGGAAIRICDDDLRARHRRRSAVDHGLSAPDLFDRCHLVYQPIMDLADSEMVGAEALLRWQDPELGSVPPAEFIPRAERSGRIVGLGAWVLSRACDQLRAWRDEGAGPGWSVAVNVSPRQLLDHGFVPTLEQILVGTRIPPGRLCVEVTESAILDHSAGTRWTMSQLVGLGVRVHIDDFGTGYASLAQLRRLPFHGLKIDRSFVAELDHDRTSRVLVAGLLGMANDLGLRVIAEGVETRAQRDILVDLGCPLAQGYLWSEPLPPEHLALHGTVGQLLSSELSPGRRRNAVPAAAGSQVSRIR